MFTRVRTQWGSWAEGIKYKPNPAGYDVTLYYWTKAHKRSLWGMRKRTLILLLDLRNRYLKEKTVSFHSATTTSRTWLWWITFLSRIYGRKFNEKPCFLEENRLAFTAISQAGQNGTRELPSFLLWYLLNAAGPKESVVTMATWHSALHEMEGGACLPCLAHTAHPLPLPDSLPVETQQAHVTTFLCWVFSVTAP